MLKLLGSILPAVAFAVGLAIAPAAHAVDFSGEQITFYVPGSPGTGNDLYARSLQPLLERHLPGNPTILVRNIPGAGNIAGMNTFQQQAEPDGLHLVAVTISIVTNYVFREPNVRYDLGSLIPVLVSPQGAVVYSSPSLGIEGPEDIAQLRDHRLIAGGGNPTGSDLRVILMYDLLGLDVTNVWGLSRGNARQGFERQELNINYDSTPAYLGSVVDLVDTGMAVPLFTMGIANNAGEIERDPNFPDLPHFLEVYEMVHGEPLSGTELDAWRTLMLMATMANKYIALPEGTPDDIVETYVTAVRAFIDELEASGEMANIFDGYEQFLGQDGVPVLNDAIEISDDAWEFLDTWLQENEGVSLGG